MRRAAAAGIASQMHAIGDAASRLPCARRASTQRWWPARRTSVGCCPAAWPTCWSCLPMALEEPIDAGVLALTPPIATLVDGRGAYRDAFDP